jgi:hypothetical protein
MALITASRPSEERRASVIGKVSIWGPEFTQQPAENVGLERIGPGHDLFDMTALNAFECLRIEPQSCWHYPGQNHLSLAHRTATTFNPVDGVLVRDMMIYGQHSARFFSWANPLLSKVSGKLQRA